MANIQSNSSISSNKALDAAQSGFALRERPARSLAPDQNKAITLDVIAVKNNYLLLQERQNGQKLLIERNALQNSANPPLVKGDSLVLLSTSQQSTLFVLAKNEPETATTISQNTLKNVAGTLSKHWPNMPITAIKQTAPQILNQVNIAANTQQSRTLATALISLAATSGQPTLTLNAAGTTFWTSSPGMQGQVFLASNTPVPIHKSLANTLSLYIHAGTNKYLALDIPLQAKSSAHAPALKTLTISQLSEIANTSQKVNITFDANSQQRLIRGISISSDPAIKLSSFALKDINQLLSHQSGVIRQALSNLIVTPQSNSLSSGIVFAANGLALQELGPSIKQHLTSGVSTTSLHSATILVAQHQQKTNQIEVSLLAKPITISIDNAKLAGLDLSAGTNKLIAASLNAEVNKAQFTNNTAIDHAATYGKNKTSALLGPHTEGNNHRLTLNANLPKADSAKFQSSEPLSSANAYTQTLKEQTSAFLSGKGLDAATAFLKLDALQATIFRELHQLSPTVDKAGEALPNLLKQLQLIGKSATGELKASIGQLSQQISDHIPKIDSVVSQIDTTGDADEIINAQSARSIKDMFSSAMLPSVLTAPITGVGAISAQSGLMNGLVTMLQASLQAKLFAQQPLLLGALIQSAALTQRSPASQSAGKPNAGQAKVLQELAKLDPNGNLIGELNKVLSGHSLHKMSSAEASLHQHDSFYYVLPNLFSPQHKDIEIVIKREHASHSQGPQGQQAWQLNMKLDIGKSGEVLAKVKLSGNNLELNLYASNASLKDKIVSHLPQLNRRFTSLGLSVKPQCFLGKIPNTLHKTSYQVVQTYV